MNSIPNDLRYFFFIDKNEGKNKNNNIKPINTKYNNRIKSVNYLRKNNFVTKYGYFKNKYILCGHQKKPKIHSAARNNINSDNDIYDDKFFHKNSNEDSSFNNNNYPISTNFNKKLLNFENSSKKQTVNFDNLHIKKFEFQNPIVKKSNSSNYIFGYDESYQNLGNKSQKFNYNSFNLNNLWNELYVLTPYRKLFWVIYNELEDEDKDDFYQKEKNDLQLMKENINNLVDSIKNRIIVIKEIYELNKKLNQDIINEDNNGRENILNEISNNINVLREKTVNVCFAMQKLKKQINSVKNLKKYDINIIAEKFSFDKNYLIKMKNELNFLREGFSKYFFNISNEQTPFLLKTIENKNNEPFVHLIPITNEKLNDNIKECNYYIYLELIAYQNEKGNTRCISPLKRTEQIEINEKNDNINLNGTKVNLKNDGNFNRKDIAIKNNINNEKDYILIKKFPRIKKNSK